MSIIGVSIIWMATLGSLGWPPSPPAPALPPPPWDHLIDPDTPDGMRATVGLGDGLPYTLVMSDEFEREGRRFGEQAGDPRWTAVSRNDDTNNNLAYFTPDAVTTRLGALEITATNTGFRDATYASGSVQGWNKFCLQGGIVDVSYTLPGNPGVPGVWPGIWMMGNLGRATFTLSTEGLWPWTYNECEREIERTAGQLISACTHRAEESELSTLSGLNGAQGRGVPEIDILETRPCSDLARMGGTLAAGPAAGTCGLSTLQVAPRLPDYLRPEPMHYPDEATSWYRDLRFGDPAEMQSEINPSWCSGPRLLPAPPARASCPRLVTPPCPSLPTTHPPTHPPPTHLPPTYHPPATHLPPTYHPPPISPTHHPSHPSTTHAQPPTHSSPPTQPLPTRARAHAHTHPPPCHCGAGTARSCSTRLARTRCCLTTRTPRCTAYASSTTPGRAASSGGTSTACSASRCSTLRSAPTRSTARHRRRRRARQARTPPKTGTAATIAAALRGSSCRRGSSQRSPCTSSSRCGLRPSPASPL